jgi:hypothetical protein
MTHGVGLGQRDRVFSPGTSGDECHTFKMKEDLMSDRVLAEMQSMKAVNESRRQNAA